MAATALTPLGITVLALLFERPMHPYEMYQLHVTRRDDRIVKIRPGSLYHTVERLERQELVAVVGTERAGNRPERTTYCVTDAGRAALTRWVGETLSTPKPEYPAFPLALAEAHNLDADSVCAAMAERIGLVEKDLAELDALRQVAVSKEIPRVFWFGFDYLRALAVTEVEWLRGLIDEIESGALPWHTDRQHCELAKG
ncbi:PadR family transcriptional regulator [Rhodococcus maanshanensis]|uniref:DNA-binding transcriptional regulator, PadR family n=1 Tax=Rhodococcus maanshanensis TaxID=183556 RepID=A0A1H7TRZ1_9NOCA|nr:PadR family transcriptional regulator [Rhodococcus maanshanensis]SEL87620.1 DNA-binding transcriptional regulator, PadR family [Rhodococcus maanshanensis]